MRRLLHRAVLPSLAIVSALLVSLLLLTWRITHTDWFLGVVRARIIAIAEKATGGRVELGVFSYNTDSLTAQAGNFIIHGKEPPGVAPLLQVEKVEVGLKILSLWRREVDIRSLRLDRPKIHVMVSKDGSTNLPSPRLRVLNRDPIQQLLDLKINHAEIRGGLLTVNDSRFPLDLTTDNLALVLSYNLADPSYDVSLSLPSADLRTRFIHPPAISVTAQAHLFPNSIRFDSLKVASGRSAVDASGLFEHFDNPSGDFVTAASFSIDDMAAFGKAAEVQNGSATARGKLHFDGQRFVFTGQAQARNVNYISGPFTLRGMDVDADIVANNEGMSIAKVVASARGAKFAGEASIRRYRFLQVQGRVSKVPLSEVARYLTDQPFPWSGSASGEAFASATLMQPDANFIIGAQVQITPEAGAIPVSGALGMTYLNRVGQVQFSPSQLSLPHSEVGFEGALTGDLNTRVNTSDLADLRPILRILGSPLQASDLPVINPGGHADFSGILQNLMGAPFIQGNLGLSNVTVQGQTWSDFQSKFSLSSTELKVSSFQVQGSGANASGSLALGLANWAVLDNQPLRLNGRFSNLNIVKTAALFTAIPLPIINGVASGSLNVEGSIAAPKGTAKVQIANLDAYGEQINQILFDASLSGDLLTMSQGRVRAGPALLSFSGDFRRANKDWSSGDVHLRADTNGFPFAGLSTVRKYLPALSAEAEAHFDAVFRVSAAGLVPLRADGSAFLRKVAINKVPYGEATFNAVTQGTSLALTYSGKLLQTSWIGSAQAKLVAGTPIHGELRMARLDFATLKSLVPGSSLPVNGFLEGGIQFDGSLEKFDQARADLTVDELQVSSEVRLASINSANATEIVLRNKAPIVIQAADGVARIRSFEITGNDTSVAVTGDAPFTGNRPLNLKAVGKVNLQIFSLFDPNVQSSGASEIAVDIAGKLNLPTVTGTLQLTNGSFFLNGIPNGLSAVNGTVVFNRNRATIQKVTARSGGGELSLGGFISFGAGSPLVYHVEGLAQNVRVRYANSISITANSNLRLSGTSTSSILAGNLTISRVVFTPTADVGNLLAAAGTSASASGDEGDFLTGLHLDIGIESAPNLQVSTNLSRDVEAEVQLRLRGTPEHPILLGSIAANQGDIRVFGTRYTLNRGEVNFVNTVRAEPVLDLDLETQTRGVTVDITVSGTPSKLNFNYRSDPPLQPRDIIALLTVGRAPGVGTTSNAQTGSDVGALTSGVNSVLGQAISPVSSRLSRLFGITNIRIDPFVQGITNTPQARLSVEQQVSRDITVTYITNLSQTSEQIFRVEWALNRQFAIVALRDDNGEFGVDFQYKKRFK